MGAQPTILPTLASQYRIVFAEDFRYSSVDSLLSPHLRKWAPEHTWGNANWIASTPCGNIGTDNVAYRREDIRLVPNPDDPRDQCVALDFNYHAEPLRQVTSARTGKVTTGEFYKTSGMLRALFRGDSLCTEEGFRYGIFEIRCRVPNISGLQAAFWLWSGNGACGPLPAGWTAGDSWEIDGFETINTNGRRDFFSTLQANALGGHRRRVGNYYFRSADEPAVRFHTYTLVWTPRTLAWYLDGKLYKRLRNPRNSDRNQVGIPDQEMGLLLSTHYQWDCKNNYHCPVLPDSVTRNDQQCPQPNDPFLVDYVRVYRPVALNSDGTWPLVDRPRQPRRLPAPAKEQAR
ncbi:hypothetical protein GCM10028821_35360 [Hymenobacter jeollabukensis]